MNVTPFRRRLAQSEITANIRNLRTNSLKPERELWQASLFAHGIGVAVLHTEIFLARVEDEDFDCVARYQVNNTQVYTPIEIKEFVPEHNNHKTSLNAELEKLAKYADSSDLVVAFYLNREFRLELGSIVIPKLGISELWFFGAVSPDASRFMLWGNMLDRPATYEYEYPEA